MNLPIYNDEECRLAAEELSKHVNGVNTAEITHTARSSSACFPVFQCTSSDV